MSPQPDPAPPEAAVGGRARVGVRTLRNQVAALLRRAEAGERVVITVDGDPVAQLGPLVPAGPPTLDDLVSTAQVVDPRGARPAPPEPQAVAVDLRLDDVLDELRGR